MLAKSLQTRQNPLSRGEIESLPRLKSQRQHLQEQPLRPSSWRQKSTSKPIRQCNKSLMTSLEKLLASGAKKMQSGSTQAAGKMSAVRKTRLLKFLYSRCARRSNQKPSQMHKLTRNLWSWSLTTRLTRAVSVPLLIRSNLS